MGDPSPQYSDMMAGVYPDPTQWSNPYSSFNQPGQMPGWPTGYVGVPMDATGKPIQSYQAPQQPAPAQGTTLNSSPNLQQQMMQNLAMARGQGTEQMGVTPYGYFSQAGGGQGVQGNGRGVPQAGAVFVPTPMPQQTTPSASTGGVQPASAGSNYQAALTALANPNQVQTPGAAWTPMQQGMGSQGILNNFINNWQKGGIGMSAQPGIGGGSAGISTAANNPFFANMGAKR